MAMVTPPPPGGRVTPSALGPFVRGVPKVLVLIAIIPLMALGGVCYWWFVQRVEVASEKVLVLVRKVGKPLPDEFANQVVLYPALLSELEEASDSWAYKGIIYAPLREGRHFFDPFFWERRIFDAEIVKAGEVGIKIRKYGRPLPPGKIVATEPNERGPLAEVLSPGRYNINPFAYEIKRVPIVQVPEGFVGVQTLFSGAEPADPNVYVVAEGERGVQPDVLPPGMYYNNPYVRQIDLIEIRTQMLELKGDEAIHFPSKDSFRIILDSTVQFAVRQDKAPYVMVAIGDLHDIEEKLIKPYAQSLARIEGSKLEAREYISGERRSAFQKRVFEGLRRQCYEQGIDIQAVLIREIIPPTEIAEPISDRQVAGQQISQYESEIMVAKSDAKLVEQTELQEQNRAIGGANREVVKVTVEAEQQKAVALTEARKRHEVAKLTLEAARETAQALLSRGQADAEVILLKAEAEAKPLADAVTAFGGGESYAQYYFYQKLAPALKSVLASTDGPFAEIFRSLSRPVPAGMSSSRSPQADAALAENAKGDQP